MSHLDMYRKDQERRNLRPSAIDRRQSEVRSFLRSLGDLDPFKADAEHVEAWLATRGQAPRTRANLISCVSCFYQWAMREELTDRDPTVKVPRPRLRRYLPRPISDPDLALALKVAPPKMRAWLSLMAFAGLRCAEVAALDAGHLLWHLDPPQVLVATGGAKGGNERMVPLASEAEMALRAAGVPRNGPVFTKSNGRPYSPANVSREVAVYLDGLGIDATAHQCRHWFGSRVYCETLDLRATQELLGHSSPTVTAVYTAFAKGAATDAVRNLRVNGHDPRLPL